MNFLRSYWFYIIAAAITIFGLITGWYIFILIAIPFGFFRNKDYPEKKQEPGSKKKENRK